MRPLTGRPGQRIGIASPLNLPLEAMGLRARGGRITRSCTHPPDSLITRRQSDCQIFGCLQAPCRRRMRAPRNAKLQCVSWCRTCLISRNSVATQRQLIFSTRNIEASDTGSLRATPSELFRIESRMPSQTPLQSPTSLHLGGNRARSISDLSADIRVSIQAAKAWTAGGGTARTTEESGRSSGPSSGAVVMMQQAQSVHQFSQA